MDKMILKADLTEELAIVRAIIKARGNPKLTREEIEAAEAEQKKVGAR